MSRLKDIVASMEPQIGQKSCKLIWDSSIGLGNRRAPKKSVSLSKKTVSFGNVAKKPRKSLVASRISFYEDHKVDHCKVEDSKTENVVVEQSKIRSLSVEESKIKPSAVENTEVANCKLKISFDDHATTTFEYDREEAALEAYLDEHPEEREALRQEEEVNAVDAINDDPTKDSTRHSESETLKSNTVIGQPTGAFTNYKSKMQIDFQFGVPTESSDDDILFEPESEHEVDPDSLQILPAQENELDAFSAEVSKADMLF